jgi:serine/threonine protein kinase
MTGTRPPAPDPDDAVCLPGGFTLLEYRIERSLGVGGFGITYLARDINLDLPVAIKEYFPGDTVTRVADHGVQVRGKQQEQLDHYQWGLERFLDEARALATFRHPNIVRVLRYFRANSTAYIVMEYESGEPLKRWVPQHTPLGEAALLRIVTPLLDGLDAVHQTGFLHRDIKPDNIYVRADGTPVLLDFGAARRVTGKTDLTNIVSPGFAPFEQYHSRGNQGPWTDIYSLGAVMYWMATGRKPMEAASRVKEDAMLPATSLADPTAFGAKLLNAIDQAMRPEESERPQSVAEFRVALGISGVSQDATLVLRPARQAAQNSPARQVANTGSPSSISLPSLRKNIIGTILFLDLVGYSIRSVDDQVALKRLFNEIIGKALLGVEESTRIAVDTGDGAAICFLGDPEEALSSALLFRDILNHQHEGRLSARVGLHMGPVRIISDINDRVNVIGDGMNVAQRIMDFARPNQVLVSRAFFDVVSRITDDNTNTFEYLGQHGDKHGRLHEVYSVSSAASAHTRRDGPTTGYTQTAPIVEHNPLDEVEVTQVEAELTKQIGPMARVLVRKAQIYAPDIASLREVLAPSIADGHARDTFRHGMPVSKSLDRSVLKTATSISRTHPPSAKHPTTLSAHPLEHTTTPSAKLGGNSGRASLSTSQLALSTGQLQGLETALSRVIGPMAKMLLRKEASRSASVEALVHALAQHIDNLTQRAIFQEEVKKLNLGR